MKKLTISIFAFIISISANIYAKPLPLPNNVIAFSSPEGQDLLKTAPKEYSQQY
ncbi:hypothetical protein [Francisella sp. 19X1-34]|uniref:hypothetical protein n=1 Tax=Francisella sp. 19X1-34 TaxID=3087177 RepID=UPI002E37391C|nr:hypothetical protein [Francisella sp. 19X1-34]MED7787787.1 hypothetical protein [Francisella sp. 19X1-34]